MIKKTVSVILVVLFIVFGFTLQTLAITRVFVQNNTPLSFRVECSQSGYHLASDKWGQKRNVVKPAERAEVIWFNRDDGIKDGKEFTFVTMLHSDDLPVYLCLAQFLRGVMVNSHMWQTLLIPACEGFSGI